jgi:mono/diheme cytochrome c family protein
MRALGCNEVSIHAFVFVCFVACFVAACAEEEYPTAAVSSTDAGAATPDVYVAPPTGPRYCTQSRAESLPARLTAMSTHASVGGQVVLVSQLFDDFQTACGQCHGTINSMGGFQIATPNDFTLAYIKQENVVSHITSNIACPFATDPSNPQEPMPPCGQMNAMPYSQRGPDDEIKIFADLLQQWVAAGGPQSFTPTTSASAPTGDAGADAGAPVSQFAMTPANGNAMTNLGNCIPSQGLVGIDSAKIDTMDAMFAAAKSQQGGTPAQILALPEKLSETDLFTLDSDTLAQSGVIAYVPGYPLWSDNAGKLRYVRVPHGQSIHFNKATQQFEIPPNTRFYKTFMKLIADTDGSYRYRKIETRLIVSRPDQNNPDGSAAAQTALFGTYRWRDDESEADLDEDLLRDNLPFPDDLTSYNTDEQLAAQILSGQPLDPEEALVQGHALRHYAIPSSQRCVQCHMGSPSQSFVLGFTPLEINRRPVGAGGTIEATGPDELTQLQRLIDYGVITGIDAPSDVLLLEKSQGNRSPRNNAELIAQGYMLGNCAHCHNPRGYPTTLQPLLKDLFNVLPGAAGGGIFQYPLESYSPDIFRGRTGTLPMPFITPSLMDLPRLAAVSGLPAPDPFISYSATDGVLTYGLFAPWRSLIYRNVSSAFTYEDDLALFPHMPLNTPGFDVRAKQIMSDWMVSIPAVRKDPEIPEYAFYDTSGKPQFAATPDTNNQPYVEVLPGDPRYPDALAAAQARLSVLHTSLNPSLPPPADPFVPYADPGDTSDIVDPQVELDPTCHPSPDPGVTSGTNTIPVPFIDHPHWVETDLSQASGAYVPRRQDWAMYLVSGETPAPPTSCPDQSSDVENAYQDQKNVLALDQSATLEQTQAVNGVATPFSTWATTPLPMGLWQQKAGCNFSSQKTVAQYTGADRAHWMDYAELAPPPPANAPVYTETAGAAVFKMICINCHGKHADGNGFIAQNLTLLTGGLARVADFRDGLFGPATTPGSNIHLAFGTAALPQNAGANWTGITDDDRTARYMAWMALGGTEVVIPPEVLSLVQETPVFGVPRLLGVTSANMLSTAKGLCASLLGGNTAVQLFSPGQGYLDVAGLDPSLIHTNGDAELWLRMCTFANPSAVHVLRYNSGQPALPYAVGNSGIDFSQLAFQQFVDPAAYVANGGTSIGDERGNVITLASSGASGGLPTNWPQWPWCIDMTGVSPLPATSYPICPAGVTTLVRNCDTQSGCWTEDAANTWAVRGAMNAGFSVFLYVQALELLANPPPDYTQCDQLQ